MIPLSTAGLVGLGHDEVPHAGIITRVAQQIGGSFGVAVLAVILDAALRNLGTHSGSAALAAKAFDQAFWWAVGFTGVAFVPSLTLPGRTPRPIPIAASKSPSSTGLNLFTLDATVDPAAPRQVERAHCSRRVADLYAGQDERTSIGSAGDPSPAVFCVGVRE